MRMSIDATAALRSTIVLALSLAAVCGRTGLPLPPPLATTVITFDDLATATPVDRQYLSQGVEFVRGPLFDGFGAAPRLPSVWKEESGNGLVDIRPFEVVETQHPDRNRMWGILRFPTRRVKVRVRNVLPGAVEVQLVVRDNQGILHRDRKVIPMDQGSSTGLEVKAEGPDFTEFLVFAQGGLILVDDVTIDYPR
jgi:hypothetical protein